MELRKNPKIDLEKKRGMFFSIGLCLSLLFVLSAFQWTSEVKPIAVWVPEPLEDYSIMIEPILTRQDPPPRPEVIKSPSNTTNIVIDNEIDKLIVEVDPMIDPGDDIDFTDIVIPDEEVADVAPFVVVEHMPEPDGGMKSFMSFLAHNIKYPRRARTMGIEGKVYAQFVVDTDGALINLKVVKGIGGGCDEEALRVIALSPKWNPGIQRNRAVKVRMIVPVAFRLR